MRKLGLTGVSLPKNGYLGRVWPCLSLLTQTYILVAFCAFLISCGSQTILPSVEFDSCFLDYKDKSYLEEQLQNLNGLVSPEAPNPTFKAVIGCLHYQKGNVGQAEEWLKTAYQEAKENDTAKGTAAAALGLIYIKHQKPKKEFKPYEKAAHGHRLGRWMLVLQYIDWYRRTGDVEELGKAIEFMDMKHQKEGDTPETMSMLKHMGEVYQLAQMCGGENMPGPEDDCSSFKGKKIYLFSLYWGFLNILLKEPPFNSM